MEIPPGVFVVSVTHQLEMEPFPTSINRRSTNTPPTSGGFYKASKLSVTTTKLRSKSPNQREPLPTLVLLLDKPKKDFREDIQRIAHVKIPPRKNFKYFHKFENVVEGDGAASAGKTDAKPVALLNSFSSHSCFLGIDNRKTVGVQTEPSPVVKQEFVDLKDFRKWGSNEVDPFVKELRKVLMTQKPSSIERYVMAYCSARLMGEPAPDTVDPVRETPAMLSKKLNLRNNVTTKNSLIRVRSTKSSKMDSSLAVNQEEHETQSETEHEAQTDAVGHEDFHSLSDDNASEISDASF